MNTLQTCSMPLRTMLGDALSYLKESNEWDGPLSLTDMLCIPEHLTPLVSDYKMNLIQIRNSDSLIFHNNEVHTVFDLSRLIYDKEFDKIQSTYMNQKFATEPSLVIGTISKIS